MGINNNGLVTGTEYDQSSSVYSAFIVNLSGKFISLGDPGEGFSPYGINDDAQMSGASGNGAYTGASGSGGVLVSALPTQP